VKRRTLRCRLVACGIDDPSCCVFRLLATAHARPQRTREGRMLLRLAIPA
jgi:hypothetical protein